MNKSLKLAMQLLLGAFLVSSSPQALAEKLDLSKGTMTLGGAGGFSQSGSVNGHRGYDAAFFGGMVHKGKVDFGYFVMNRLAIMVDLHGQGLLNMDNLITDIGFGAGPSYFFDIDSIVSPYVGLKFNFDYDAQGSAFTWGGAGAAGILIALNQHVAVDLGLSIGGNFSKRLWNNNLGFVGVRGFF